MTITREQSRAVADQALRRRMRSHRLLHRMLARQGIDPTATAWRDTEAMLIRALGSCAHCAEKAACRAWLAGNAPAASYVRFCPNSETIETLRITGS